MQISNMFPHQTQVGIKYASGRSDRTLSNYSYRFNSLHKKALERVKYYGLPPSEQLGLVADIKDIVDQLEILAGTTSSSNFATCRCAVLYYLVASIKEGGEAALINCQPEIDRATRIKSEFTHRHGKYPETVSMRRVVARDLVKLSRALRRYVGTKQYGGWTDDWISATLAAGLRPNEWETAKLVSIPNEGGLAPTYELHCRNSKRKTFIPPFMDIEEARGDDPGASIDSVFDMEVQGLNRTAMDRETHRKISIRAEDVAVIDRHLQNLESNLEAGISFDKTYDSCRKLLHRTCMDIFKGEKVYTFYSFRHEFYAKGKTRQAA